MSDSVFLARASECYHAVCDLPILPEIRPSQLWVTHIRDSLRGAMTVESLADLVRDVTENNRFSLPRKNSDPEFHPIICKYVHWLERHGLPLDSLDSLMQESHLASPEVTINLGGRVVSTAFLYHLSIAWRLVCTVGRNASPFKVIELGGGHGGHARVLKLLAPCASIVILDLAESLWFSYLFLCAHFPEARIVYCTSLEQVHECKDYDFVLVPTALIEGLYGQAFDIFVNTASLGEMTDAAVVRYMQLVQNDTQTRFIYSINRYGNQRQTMKHRGSRQDSPDSAKVSLRLDPFWRILEWKLFDNSFAFFEPHSPPQLEVVGERVPRFLLPDSFRKSLSERLLIEANLMAREDDKWHFLIWESVRLHASEANLSAYLNFLARNNWVELQYYQYEFERITGKRLSSS